MLSALRRCFPEARLTLLVRRYAGAIVEHHPLVEEILWYDEGDRMVEWRAMRRVLREGRFDAAVVVYPTFRLAWIVFAAGIPLRVGTGYRLYSAFFNRRVYDHRKDARMHEVEYNLRLLEPLGCAAAGPPEFLLEVQAEAACSMRRILAQCGLGPEERLAVLHPGSGGSAREWSPEHFGRTGAILAEGGYRVVVTGTGSEREKAERVCKAGGGRPVSLAGRLTLPELTALLGTARLLVANSTGPVHLAAALGTPVVGLYPQHAPMSARRWGPWTDRKAVFVPRKDPVCRDCRGGRDSCPCMDSITPQEVAAAALRLLAGRAGSPAGSGKEGMS